MIWIAILVAFSSLTFKGLTLVKLWAWFNIHPFLFIFTLNMLIAKFGIRKEQ